MTVLYISHDGITDHIGRSQIAPYVLGLAEMGFRIHLLTAEKSGRSELVERYQGLFDAAGVRWTRARYRNRPQVFGQAATQLAMRSLARRIRKEGEIRLVHCRGFPPASIGYGLKRESDVRFIFDFRDFWADGGLERFHGLRRLAFLRMKRLEAPMIRGADKVVCLTAGARQTLVDWYFTGDPDAQRRFEIIPCCADFAHFDLSSVSSDAREEARREAGLDATDLVLLYLGSLGTDYLLPRMMSLFRQLSSIRSNARFLFVSNNGRELVDAEAARQGVPADRICFVSADRDRIPAFIALADLSVFFYREGLRSVGCSPTKLAELFACNVPVIANSGVGDLDAILDLERNGSVAIPDFRDETLRSALEAVLARRDAGGSDIRGSSGDFRLEEGIRRYAAVYRELLRP